MGEPHMPRLSKSVPKYRKHRASGQAVVTLSGVDHYLGPHGTKTSKVEYDRLIGEWLVGGRTLPSDDGITVVELWNGGRSNGVNGGQLLTLDTSGRVFQESRVDPVSR